MTARECRCFVFPLLAIAASYFALGTSGAAEAPEGRIVYLRDVAPILEARCYDCHGPDKRKGGLRLSSEEDALTGGDSLEPAYVAGAPAESLLIQRVTAGAPDKRMPPKGEPLSAAEIEALRRWISEGAVWTPRGDAAPAPIEGADHWAYQKPAQGPLPEVTRKDWPRNPIDNFILARIEAAGLAPSPEADRRTLIRRLSLDLTGLPPSPEEVEAFAQDGRPDAYERLTERLLASPRYGEHQAAAWLDIARYADTNGYEKDRPRSIWPYRDWVIHAFNEDKPFDRFVIEQLAGDLLPNATQDQRIATGFHRNTMLNEEGGVDVEEFRYEAVVDRTNTTATAFLGLTMACAQCHSHKYDPITQREYFQFYAFLNNTDDVEMPVISEAVTRKRAEVQAEIDRLVAGLAAAFPVDEADGNPHAPEAVRRHEHLERKFGAWRAEKEEAANRWTILDPLEFSAQNHATLVKLSDHSILARGDIPNNDVYEVAFRAGLEGITALRLEVLPHPSLPGGGPGRGVILAEGDFLLSEIHATAAPWNEPGKAAPLEFVNPSHSYAGDGRSAELALDRRTDTGWGIKGQEGKPHAAVFPFAAPVGFPGGTSLKVKLDQIFIHQHTIGRFRISVTTDPAPRAADVPAEIEAILAESEEQRSAADAQSLLAYYLTIAPELADIHQQIEELRASMPKYPTTLVLEEREDTRVTRIHHRGEFLQPRGEVGPDVPAVLPRLPENAPRNRLTLAKWLVSSENPLTARVTVNRLWQRIFGRGIVTTPDDFGVRGAAPTHPELLDWLAVEFVRRGWSVKDITRLIVTSATYRQDARVTPELLAADPNNELLARAPRFRVDAEVARDAALAAAGLLDSRIGGPSVFPPLPDGVKDLAYGGVKWEESQGPDRYRRGIYTYWKRTLPYPVATLFDAPARDAACTRRTRSNTPLQALSLLNDDVYMEAARAMAQRIRRETSAGIDVQIQRAFQLCLSRPPDEQELEWVKAYYERELARFHGAADPKAVLAREEADNVEDWAALTLVCRVLLNLDEAITRG